ncbi:somatostatin receptor type 2-like [Glandiceps talaboti]
MATTVSWSTDGAVDTTNLSHALGNHTANFTDHLLLSPGPGSALIPVIIVSLFHSLTCIVGTIGNLLVIIVLLNATDIRVIPNIYILNLAIADFLFLLSVPFLLYQYVSKHWVFGQVMCKIVMSLDGMNMFTGVFLLTAMSIDRYLALVHPLQSRVWRTVRTTRIVCILMWAFSSTLCLPLWLYAGEETEMSVLCIVNFPRNIEKAFILISFVNGYVVPLVIIAVCYVSIACHVTTSRVGSPGQAIMHTSPKNDSNSKRVAVLVVAAIIAFAVCWFPFYAMQLYTTFSDMSNGRGVQEKYLIDPDAVKLVYGKMPASAGAVVGIMQTALTTVIAFCLGQL